MEAGLSLTEFWRATPRITNLALKAYRRRWATAAWHAGLGIAPGKPKDLTFDKLAGTAPAARPAMSVDRMEANFRRFAVAHNAALAARGEQQGNPDDGR